MFLRFLSANLGQSENALVCVCVCVCVCVVAALFAEHLGVLCIFDHVNVNNLQFLVAYFGVQLPTKKAPSANMGRCGPQKTRVHD